MAASKIKHVDDSDFTITRVRYGRGHSFLYHDGTRVKDKKQLNRLKKLVIPPMWTEVYVCGFPDGHIQATGRDAKGRKQYIYHSEWQRLRQQEKFDKMIDFGKRLPHLRKAAHRDLDSKGWSEQKVLALMIMVLDSTGIRIGNKQYADRNGTYGLSTLRRKHMEDTQEGVLFHFKGKSGKQREVEIHDEELIALIQQSADLPGYELFRYRDDSGTFRTVDSDEVNDYIEANMGSNFSSKDFRTWVASRLAIEYYPEAIELKKDAPRRKFSNMVIRAVADELGNTPSVCKNYYVHPDILEGLEERNLPIIEHEESTFNLSGLSASEEAVLQVLEKTNRL